MTNGPNHPLRVLVAVSRPIAQEIAVEHEGQTYQAISPIPWPPVQVVRDGLRQVLRQEAIPIAVRFLPHATLAGLGQALAEPYDVLHFAGHGAEDGSLFLEREDGTADPVEPAALAETLRGADVRLALLSACYSAKAGLALQAGGIPAVVMVDEAWPMDARAAALFNGQFYTWLARGRRPREAFNAGVRAVKGDAVLGTRGEQPVNPDTGAKEPYYWERFREFMGEDHPLVAAGLAGEYREVQPLRAACTVAADDIFVGREWEQIDAIRALQAGRWLTLVGPGGIGKTSLARRVARWQHERNHFPDGVLAVDAAGAATAAELADRFGTALAAVQPGFQVDPRRPWAGLAAALAGCCLAVVDNADDLAAEAVQALDGLLGQAADLRLLVTSRQRLGAVGHETALEVEQMAVGAGPVVGPAERTFLAYTPAERRAEAAEQLGAVRELCREVGGYPLALVLAAAQLADRTATVGGILGRVRAAMPEALAYARAASLPERHRSVGAALKSSFDRLSPAARLLAARVALLPGGASEELLEALEGGPGWRPAAEELRHGQLARWAEGRYTMLPPSAPPPRAWRRPRSRPPGACGPPATCATMPTSTGRGWTRRGRPRPTGR